MTLRRILGAPTALLLGMGVAIGSGIFRTPGIVAGQLHAPWLILLAWLFGGVFVLMCGMVTAELATRFPCAGGEYVYLREAFGEFVAFCFGWAYTVFIVGGGAATIAAALGDFACDLFALPARASGPIAAGAVVLVTAINLLGLRTGAVTQNLLTGAKIAAVLVLIFVGFLHGRAPIEWFAAPAADGPPTLAMLIAGGMTALWAYTGSTDPAKLAEEIRDVRRALPLALIGSAVLLTIIYVLANIALMRIIPAGEMSALETAELTSVPGEAMGRLFGETGRRAMLVVAILVCFGAISSAILATVRVTFALARDGLAFRAMARMSAAQAPIPALLVVCALAVVLVLWRGFMQVLHVYFFASSILFGLAYVSLLVLRRRRPDPGPEVYRCPAAVLQVALLTLIQLAIAASILIEDPAAAAYTLGLFLVLGLLYALWKRGHSRHNAQPLDGA